MPTERGSPSPWAGITRPAGRLTLEEFQERLDRAYAAKTLCDLDDLMTDLPKTDLNQLAGQRGGNPPLQRRAQGTVQPYRGRHPAIWQFWLGVVIATFVIWLITAASGGPWFLWVAIPLAFIMLRRWSMDNGHGAQHPRPPGSPVAAHSREPPSR